VQSIPGAIGKVGDGCAFAPRCSQAVDLCRVGSVQLDADLDRSVRCLRWRETLV